jgi:hypothetical protein
MEDAMKKLALAALFVIVASLAFGADPLPYDSAAIKDIMHSNGATAGAINKALAAGDFVAVGNGFIQFAQNAQKAAEYAPPKGDPAEWSKLWDDFLFTAYKGVGAAGAKDAAGAKNALGQIFTDMKSGHGTFKG